MDRRCGRHELVPYHIAVGSAESIGLNFTGGSPFEEGDTVTAYFTAENHTSIAVTGTIDENKVIFTLTSEQTFVLGQYSTEGHRIHMCAHVTWAAGDVSPIVFGGTEIEPIYELPIRMIACHRV